MSREMNDLIFKTLKYDAIIGFIFVLVLSLSLELKMALTFLSGFMVSIISFMVNAVALKYSFKYTNSSLATTSSLFRILIVALIAVPFSNNFTQLILYLAGYMIHLIIIVISAIKNSERK